jgi:hypothetical protein
MTTSLLDKYFGVPVMLQLRIPLVMIQVAERQKLPHADDKSLAQWIPTEIMEGTKEDPRPANCQLIRYAVLRRTEVPGKIELLWLGPGPKQGIIVTLASLLDEKDIAFVTRIEHMPDGPPLIQVASA